MTIRFPENKHHHDEPPRGILWNHARRFNHSLGFSIGMYCSFAEEIKRPPRHSLHSTEHWSLS